MNGVFAPEGKLATILNTIGDLIVVNLLTVLLCIPVVTAGAAISACYHTSIQIVRKEDGHIASSFFKAFRDDFKQSTVIGLAGGGLVAFILFDISVLRQMSGSFAGAYRIVLFIFALFTAMLTVFALVTASHFKNTLKNTVKNGILFCLIHPLKSILVFLVMLIPFILTGMSMRFLLLTLLLGFSGPAFITGFYFSDLFSQFETVENEE